MSLKKLIFFSIIIFSFCKLAIAENKVNSPANIDSNSFIDIPSWISLHGQYTNVSQYHSSFTSPSQFTGPNSMTSSSSIKSTNDLTLYLGIRLGKNTEVFFNPEIDQGYGLTNTLGMAGFPSGEAYKVGKGHPYYKVPRYFVRQTFNLGGEITKIEDDINQTSVDLTADNLIITAGKFSVVDVFDTNIYAHDPKGDFLNWSILEGGAFDYAADSWGFTYGAAAELSKDWWTARIGIFALSTEPNMQTIDKSFHQYESVFELEERHKLWDQSGKFKILVFANKANMGTYTDAIANMRERIPSVADVRRYATKTGLVLNAEQSVNDYVGWFARISMNDGSKEAYDFTEINRSYSTGLVFEGKFWNRVDDRIGVAFAVNQLSSEAQQYFKLGGQGILIGDTPHPGYASEEIFEAFYSAHIEKHTTLTLDYQFANNPAYNPARGPINLLAFRAHFEF